MTAISLLSIRVDSPPEQIRLDTVHGMQLIRLEDGVHLNLTDTSEETCQALAERLLTIAGIKKGQRLAAEAANQAKEAA